MMTLRKLRQVCAAELRSLLLWLIELRLWLVEFKEQVEHLPELKSLPARLEITIAGRR